VSNVLADFGAGISAFSAPLDARLAFIRRTYLHLTGAIFAFVVLSYVLFAAGISEAMGRWAILGGSSSRWLVVLGAFAIAGWMGRAMAHGAKSVSSQYAGLALYTAGEAFIFAPFLWFARYYAQKTGAGDVIQPAAVITLVTFAGLSAIVLTTRKDFSFLSMALKVSGLVAIGLIIASCIFGFELGIWFSGAMILFAAGAILYSTSRILHNYRTDQHVGAALELFAAVALLFWYVLRLLLELQGRRR
jgi:FtsH-binding integral membrane protein